MVYQPFLQGRTATLQPFFRPLFTQARRRRGVLGGSHPWLGPSTTSFSLPCPREGFLLQTATEAKGDLYVCSEQGRRTPSIREGLRSGQTRGARGGAEPRLRLLRPQRRRRRGQGIGDHKGGDRVLPERLPRGLLLARRGPASRRGQGDNPLHPRWHPPRGVLRHSC